MRVEDSGFCLFRQTTRFWRARLAPDACHLVVTLTKKQNADTNPRLNRLIGAPQLALPCHPHPQAPLSSSIELLEAENEWQCRRRRWRRL